MVPVLSYLWTCSLSICRIVAWLPTTSHRSPPPPGGRVVSQLHGLVSLGIQWTSVGFVTNWPCPYLTLRTHPGASSGTFLGSPKRNVAEQVGNVIWKVTLLCFSVSMKFFSSHTQQYYCIPETTPCKHLVTSCFKATSGYPYWDAPGSCKGGQTTQCLLLPIPVSSWEKNQLGPIYPPNGNYLNWSASLRLSPNQQKAAVFGLMNKSVPSTNTTDI